MVAMGAIYQLYTCRTAGEGAEGQGMLLLIFPLFNNKFKKNYGSLYIKKKKSHAIIVCISN